MILHLYLNVGGARSSPVILRAFVSRVRATAASYSDKSHVESSWRAPTVVRYQPRDSATCTPHTTVRAHKVRAMVVAVQQPSAESTAIFTGM